MMFLCDDYYDRQIRIYDDDVATDREVKVLKMLLLIERSKC